VCHARHPHEAVPEQRLCTHFRGSRRAENPGFQIYGSVAQRSAVLIRLLDEPQAHTGCLIAHLIEKVRPDGLDETFAGAQGEGSYEFGEVGLRYRSENGFPIPHELTDPLADLHRARRGNKRPAGAYEQWVASGLTQPC
jgi:hypothetical protein